MQWEPGLFLMVRRGGNMLTTPCGSRPEIYVWRCGDGIDGHVRGVCGGLVAGMMATASRVQEQPLALRHLLKLEHIYQNDEEVVIR